MWTRTSASRAFLGLWRLITSLGCPLSPMHHQQGSPFPSCVALIVKQTFFKQNLLLKDKIIPRPFIANRAPFLKSEYFYGELGLWGHHMVETMLGIRTTPPTLLYFPWSPFTPWFLMRYGRRRGSGKIAGCVWLFPHLCSAKRLGLGVRQAWIKIFTVLPRATTDLLGSAPLEQ